MRRTIFLLTAMVALVLCSTAAFAALRMGTNNGETLTGTNSADVINGLGGNDTLKGLAGNDTYQFDDGFGIDTLEELPKYGKKPGGNDRVSFAAYNGTNGSHMRIGLIPEWRNAPCWGDTTGGLCSKAWEANGSNQPTGLNQVLFTSTAPERAVGGTGNDVLMGGKEANVLNGGPGNDSLIDYGGTAGTFGFPALPASNDTLKAGLGFDWVYDYGGSADTLDLRAMGSSDDVYFSPNGSDLLILKGDSSAYVNIVGALDASTPMGKMEQIIFTDEVISGAYAQRLANAQARAQGSANGERLAEMVKEALEKTPTETPAPLPVR